MAAIRALLIEQRSELTAVVGTAEMSAAVELLAARVLEQFEGLHGTVEGALAGVVPDAGVTGWPAGVRRAG
jgi:hypothetical protein